jgi:hypothetical protein
MEKSNKSLFSVPVVNRRPWGQLSLVLNIFPVPGIGSLVAGVKSRHYGSVLVGIILAVVNIVTIALNYINPAGWIVPTVFAVWALSILLGVRIFTKSKK